MELPPVAPLRVVVVEVFWLAEVSLHSKRCFRGSNLQAAMLIALKTLCQLLSTNATAINMSGAPLYISILCVVRTLGSIGQCRKLLLQHRHLSCEACAQVPQLLKVL